MVAYHEQIEVLPVRRPRPVRAKQSSSAHGRNIARFERRAAKLAAIILAVGFHLLVIAWIGGSIAQTKLSFVSEANGEGGAISVGLTRAPASALQAASSQDRLDAAARTLSVSQVEPDASPNGSSTAAMLQEMDELTGSSHNDTRATASGSAHRMAASGSGVALKSQDNPWAHAAVAQIDSSKTNELWAAVKPCWRGSPGAAQSSIRVAINEGGEVTDMISLSSGDRSNAQALASAINACGPYAFAHGRAFLVVGPL